MRLELDRHDLQVRHSGILNCSQILFEHFKPEVRAVIIAVGHAVFWEYDRLNYNAIYPPREMGDG